MLCQSLGLPGAEVAAEVVGTQELCLLHRPEQLLSHPWDTGAPVPPVIMGPTDEKDIVLVTVP